MNTGTSKTTHLNDKLCVRTLTFKIANFFTPKNCRAGTERQIESAVLQKKQNPDFVWREIVPDFRCRMVPEGAG